MLKKSISISLLWIVFLTAFSPLRLNAQIRSEQAAKNEAAQTNSATPDLKKIVSDSFVQSPARLDAKQMQRESLNSAKRAKLSKGQKTGLYIGIAAAVVVTIIIVVAASGGNDDDGGFVYAGCPNGNTFCQ